jgi:mRNA interferase RelE/StbE
MAYRVVWRPQAEKSLKALPAEIVRRIAKKVETHLVHSPRQLGEAMLGGFGGLYRYRIGDYRVIYDINDEQITIYIILVGHRKNVYKE